MKNNIYMLVLLLCSVITQLFAQGPPITADKPIMLGAKRMVIKTLTEVRTTEKGTYTRVPIMAHYLPTSNSLIAIHLPLVYANGGNSSLGDVQVLGKYQFYRKDKTAKTFRMVLKALETLPTGGNWDVSDISYGKFQSYLGVVVGYESIKYGVSNEIGYNVIPDNEFDEFRYRLGFGLPLLKPIYPVKQINLFFEYTSNWMTEINQYELLYAQGIQYAIKQLTFEAAYQWPLVQTINEKVQRKHSVFLGTRYVF